MIRGGIARDRPVEREGPGGVEPLQLRDQGAQVRAAVAGLERLEIAVTIGHEVGDQVEGGVGPGHHRKHLVTRLVGIEDGPARTAVVRALSHHPGAGKSSETDHVEVDPLVVGVIRQRERTRRQERRAHHHEAVDSMHQREVEPGVLEDGLQHLSKREEGPIELELFLRRVRAVLQRDQLVDGDRRRSEGEGSQQPGDEDIVRFVRQSPHEVEVHLVEPEREGLLEDRADVVEPLGRAHHPQQRLRGLALNPAAEAVVAEPPHALELSGTKRARQELEGSTGVGGEPEMFVQRAEQSIQLPVVEDVRSAAPDVLERGEAGADRGREIRQLRLEPREVLVEVRRPDELLGAALAERTELRTERDVDVEEVRVAFALLCEATSPSLRDLAGREPHGLRAKAAERGQRQPSLDHRHVRCLLVRPRRAVTGRTIASSEAGHRIERAGCIGGRELLRAERITARGTSRPCQHAARRG